MIEIIPSGALAAGPLPLGETATFRLYRRHGDLELRWFLCFGKVFQTKPMCDWSMPAEIGILPEAPGRYRVAVQWRRTAAEGVCVPDPTTDRGWETFDFEVLPSGYDLVPSRASRGRKRRYWAPNQFEAKGISRYESALLDALPGLVPPGSVVYDVGANIGLYSVPLSRATGPEGKVYCFEPNPICVSYLHVNLTVNECDNCQIVPLAITDGAARVSLTVNFANSLVGISDRSELYGTKAGQEIVAQGGPLEAITDFFPIDLPDVIKVDVEGAEGAVARGMQKLLLSVRPLLLFEIHGLRAAREVVAVLEGFGYFYEDIESGQTYANGAALLERFDGVRQLVCRPRPIEEADPAGSG